MYGRSADLTELFLSEESDIRDRIALLNWGNPQHRRRLIRLKLALCEITRDRVELTKSELELEESFPLARLVPILELKYRHWLGERVPMFAGATEE